MFDELNRICLHSQSKKDFVKYAAKWIALRWLIKGSAISLNLEYLPSDENDDPYLEWAIACMASREEPFRRQHAIQWLLRQKAHITANSVTIEDWANFKALFEIRISTLLPEQLSLNRGPRQVIWEIPFTNHSLHAVNGQTHSVSINRPEETDQIYSIMDDCFESCAEAFESLNEYRAKFTWHVSSCRSELFLPLELFLRTKVCQRLRAALDRNSLGNICNLKDLQEELWLGVDSFGHELEALVVCSESLGFMIQPDPRLRVLEPNRIKTVLIERGQAVLESDDRPALATAMKSLWLGGWYESPEVLEGIVKVISSTFDLQDGANRHLHLFARWLTAAAVKAPKSLALSVPEPHHAVTAKCFLDCLSVHSTPSIVKAVTNAMASWGFDWSVVYGRLDMSSPRTGGKGETKSRSASQVDKSLAAQIMEESAITSKMIDEVFNVVELDHAPLPMVSESTSQSKGSEFGVSGDLTSPSSTKAIISILKGGEMSKQEFQALALAHGVMVSALVEQLNDFALDSCGAVLVIQGEAFEIDEEILRELANDEHQN